MLFVRVVPLIRTPPGVEAFDYAVPEGMMCSIGTLVTVPFRRALVPALVIDLMKTSAFSGKVKQLAGVYADIVFPHTTTQLLAHVAERTFSSLPLVLSSWLRTLPKRPSSFPSHPKQSTSSSIQAHWSRTPSHDLLDRTRALLAEHKRVLLLTPWHARVDALATAFPEAQTLDARINDGDAFRAWASWQASSEGLLITTRLGAWLSPLADHTLLDEPENDDYKQDELAPRYDARKIVFWASNHAHTSLETFGVTPTLHVHAPAPTLAPSLTLIEKRPRGGSVIPCIQSTALQALLDHDGPRVIIHPVRGVFSRLRCRECGTEPRCTRCGCGLRAELTTARCPHCALCLPIPETCTRCGGVDLGKSLPGIERLKSAWATHYPTIAVDWRDLRNESINAPLQSHARVLVTEPTLLGGVTEDVRRQERLVIGFRRLASRVAEANGELLMQTPPQNDDANTESSYASWLRTEGFAKYRAREIDERKLFEYPPTVRLVKCIVEGTPEQAEAWIARAKRLVPANWRGPYPIDFRSKSRKLRFIAHAVFPASTTESTIVKSMHPLKGLAWIDLDPIAFFK